MDLKFCLDTKQPLAYESKDRAVPGGALMDSTSGKSFADKVRELYLFRKKDGSPSRSFALLDLGCAGGKFVKEVIDNGDFAVGLEGSEYSLARQRAEWATIPNNLFCCDITHPFTVYSGLVFEKTGHKTSFRFDCVTAWEVLEHIKEKDLNVLLENVLYHLMPDGIFCVSVSSQNGYHHETVRNKDWWMDKFESYYLKPHKRSMDVIGDSWVRGPGEPNSFNVALRRTNICPGYPEYDA